MEKVYKTEFVLDGELISIEAGRIARQSSAAVIIKAKKTVVLCAVSVSTKPLEGCNFVPLTVNYLEKQYAAGKIPGGYIKRETKPSDHAILVSRLIDRSLRPTVAEGFHNDINITCTVLSYDPDYSPDVLSIIGASAALALSEVPTNSTVAGVRIGLFESGFKINPANYQSDSCSLDLVVSGSESSILMVESESKELSEEKVVEAIELGQKNIFEIVLKIKELSKECGKQKFPVNQRINSEAQANLLSQIEPQFIVMLDEVYKIRSKIARSRSMQDIHEALENKLISSGLFESLEAKNVVDLIIKKVVRDRILNQNIRIDGRKPDEIREILIETDILPQAHGSALFTRGETQALVVTTLGIGNKDKQLVDNLGAKQSEESFMLHYNFPPYCVGEVGQLKSPGRREIGHGKLAWRAINPILPSSEHFDYAIRVVSEIMESDGSSSMATVCGTSLSLMDSGVPIKSPVAGIAMGLILERGSYKILSDIMGDEDHLGDMDFKVAGTRVGITALQMDIKINGVSKEILIHALEKAKIGRSHILEKMNSALSLPRSQVNKNVPKVEIIQISPRKIKDLIGPRGVTIKDICSSSGAAIDVEDSGAVKISSNSSDSIKRAVSLINEATFDPELGDIFEGPVVKIIDAGAFVSISPTKDGFVHISELANYRVDFVEDIISEGDIIKTKVIGFDKKGRPKLSYRSVDQKTGEDISEAFLTENENQSRR